MQDNATEMFNLTYLVVNIKHCPAKLILKREHDEIGDEICSFACVWARFSAAEGARTCINQLAHESLQVIHLKVFRVCFLRRRCTDTQLGEGKGPPPILVVHALFNSHSIRPSFYRSPNSSELSTCVRILRQNENTSRTRIRNGTRERGREKKRYTCIQLYRSRHPLILYLCLSFHFLEKKRRKE